MCHHFALSVKTEYAKITSDLNNTVYLQNIIPLDCIECTVFLFKIPSFFSHNDQN